MVLTVLNCVATIVASLAACISVVLAYYNVKETNRNNKTERERLNRQAWYQQLVLVNLVPEINDFVTESTLLLEQCKNCDKDTFDVGLQECYALIKQRKRHLESNVQSIKIFDVRLQREVQQCLENMLDFYSEVINESKRKHYIVYYSPVTVGNIKVELIDKLYNRYLAF